jgi:hypothetical protein
MAGIFVCNFVTAVSILVLFLPPSQTSRAHVSKGRGSKAQRGRLSVRPYEFNVESCKFRLIISTHWRFLFYPFSSRPTRLHWVNFLLHWVNFFLHWVNHFLFFFVYLQCNVRWRILLMLDKISTMLARKNDVLSLVLKLNRLACILKHGGPPTANVTLGRFSLDFVNRQIYIGYLLT